MKKTGEKIKTGIAGLDKMLYGGFPKGHVVAVIGPAGSGKTIMALQFLWDGLKNGEKCLAFSLEETPVTLERYAEKFGWSFKKYINKGQLLFIPFGAAELRDMIKLVRKDLLKILAGTKATRITIDPIAVLEIAYPDMSEHRKQIFDMFHTIKRTGATALVTSEVRLDYPVASRAGLIEYIADSIISLRRVEIDPFKKAEFIIEVIKNRQAPHDSNKYRYKITNKGIIIGKKVG